MSSLYYGSFKQFKNHLRAIGCGGFWEAHKNGVWRLKTKCGCTLSWSDTKRSYWTQGATKNKEQLDKRLASCFDSEPGTYRLAVVGKEDTIRSDQLIAVFEKMGLEVISF